MWPRWNTRPIAVQGFTALPTDVNPRHNVASTAPLVRSGDPVSARTRGGSAVSDWTAAERLWGQLHSVPAGIVSPRGRPPPAHQAPPRPTSGGTPSNGIDLVQPGWSSFGYGRGEDIAGGPLLVPSVVLVHMAASGLMLPVIGVFSHTSDPQVVSQVTLGSPHLVIGLGGVLAASSLRRR
jgi:hypothetical protein